MREIVILFFTVTTIIVIGMFGLFYTGVTLDQGLTCEKCDLTFGLSKYSSLPEKIYSIALFIPIIISSKYLTRLNLYPDKDINGTIQLFIAIFSCIVIITLTTFLIHKLLSFLIKEKIDNSDLH